MLLYTSYSYVLSLELEQVDFRCYGSYIHNVVSVQSSGTHLANSDNYASIIINIILVMIIIINLISCVVVRS